MNSTVYARYRIGTGMSSDVRPAMFFLANGVLSAISDNVFVATVYISEIDAALKAGEIDRAEFDRLAIALTPAPTCLLSRHRTARRLFCFC